jgi:chromosome partitioning protein
MLIAVANTKGGVGKTTISTNLAAGHAARGHTVKAIDADPDEYLYMWGMLRRGKGVQPNILLSKMTGNIYSDLIAERDAIDTVIVDVGGKKSPELIYAVGACDVLIIPAEAGQFDVWSLKKMSEVIAEMRAGGKTFRVIPVMNKISPDDRSTLTAGLQDEFERLKEFFGDEPVKMARRNAFSWAASEGKGVLEMPRNRDTAHAQDEFEELYGRVFQ